MALHRLLGFTTAVPDPEGLAAFYGELGLGGSPTTGFTGSDGGSAVLVDEGDFRRLVRVEFGCEGPEDLDAVARRLTDGRRRASRLGQRGAGRRPGEPSRARRAGGRTRSRHPPPPRSLCRTPRAPPSGRTNGPPPCSPDPDRRGASATW